MDLPALQDSLRAGSGPSRIERAVRYALGAAISVLYLQSCSPSSSHGTGAGSGASGEPDGALATGRTIADRDAQLPARGAALAVAESIATEADAEGATGRAIELRTLAGKIVERLWRIDADDRDASEALALYRAASQDLGAAGACAAARRAACLAGDFARDASVTYAELYRIERVRARRFGSDASSDRPPTSCDRSVDRELATLAAFRPPQAVLEAIDEGLERTGAFGPASSPAADSGSSLSADRAPRIVRVDAWPGPDSARVVVELDRPAGYRTGDEVLPGALWPRTFLELDGVDLGGPGLDLREVGIVTRVRTELSSSGSRVSLDLDGRAYRRVFYMQEPYRLVVDVARHPPGFDGRGPREVSRVVLDPGHGGRDTGATGPEGVMEKDITLDIAHRVGRVLSGLGIDVLLTRQDDRFVTLEERTARANGFSADLFISIHCNASEGRTHRGIETYVLDTTRDEIAVRIAARENATTRAASADLASMLSGMRLADQAQRSTRFARLLQRSTLSALQLKYPDVVDGGVHVAGFYVLVGARMPSALFETSYISNPLDEQRLLTDDYRQLLADSIANAVTAYRQGR